MSIRFENLSILVVEDTEPMLKLLKSVLETLGVGMIYTARDGDKGFDIFCSANPDIVLTDWHMEPVDGLDLIEKIRKDKESPNKLVPVIIMTGYSALQRVAKARDIGSTEFLVKPFSASDLTRRIAYVINKPRDFIDSQQFFGPDRRRIVNDEYKGAQRRRTPPKKISF